ncbi:hypothetical protein Tco_0087128 [Tanacetum coccineum]
MTTASHTHPDLTYSIGVVSRYMQSPRKSHARAIKQILYYFNGTTSFGIKYKRGNDMMMDGVLLDTFSISVHHLLHGTHESKLSWRYLRVKLSSWQPLQLRRKPKSKSFDEGLSVYKVQGDEIVTWCARVTLFDSEIQRVIVEEFTEV